MNKYVIGLLCLFAVHCAEAQWDSDPSDPTYHWGDLREGNICTDGFGGAFFTVGEWDGLRQRVGHVNADGSFTFQGSAPPYENLLFADLSGYGSTTAGLTLIPSEPPGTMIAIDWRFTENAVYAGSIFCKFDTSGLTGFQRITVNDTVHGFLFASNDRPEGGMDAVSDGQGGVHFVLYTEMSVPFFYNHLRSNGTLTYPWPGLEVPAGGIYPDGYGGVFFLYLENWPNSQTWGIRFDQDGMQQWPEARYLIRDGLGTGGNTLLLSPGRLFFARDSLMSPNTYAHYVFLVDTAGNHLWEVQGGRFAEEYSGQLIGTNKFIGDGLGGFFNNRYVAPGPPHLFRYNEDAELIASNTDDAWVDRLDDIGGAYRAFFEPNYPNPDSIRVSFLHYGSDLAWLWEDTVTAVRIGDEWWGGAQSYIAAEENGIIGMVHTLPGVIFYHLNPDGSIGPRTSVPGLPPSPVADFRILSVYPNPFNAAAYITLSSPIAADVRLQIHDVLGRAVHDEIIAGRAGEWKWRWQADHIPSGTYWLTATPQLPTQIAPSRIAKIVLVR